MLRSVSQRPLTKTVLTSVSLWQGTSSLRAPHRCVSEPPQTQINLKSCSAERLVSLRGARRPSDAQRLLLPPCSQVPPPPV